MSSVVTGFPAGPVTVSTTTSSVITGFLAGPVMEAPMTVSFSGLLFLLCIIKFYVMAYSWSVTSVSPMTSRFGFLSFVTGSLVTPAVPFYRT